MRLVIIIFLSIWFSASVFGQDNNWILGTWKGIRIKASEKVADSYVFSLEIKSIKKNIFKGTIESLWAKDSSVKLRQLIKGKIHNNFLTLSQGEIVYKKGFPNNLFWTNCSYCSDVKYFWKQENDSLILTGERVCEPNCTGTFLFSKKTNRSITPIKDTLRTGEVIVKRELNIIAKYAVVADSAEVRIYDNGVVDGDIVSVIYNDNLLASHLIIKDTPFTIKIPIVRGQVNRFILYAENLGSIPPNTALVRIRFDNKEVELNLTSDFIKNGAIEFVKSSTITF